MNKVSIYSLELTNEQMLEILGVSHMTLYRWREEKGFPHFKVGSNVRYKMEEVEKWLENNGASTKTKIK